MISNTPNILKENIRILLSRGENGLANYFSKDVPENPSKNQLYSFCYFYFNCKEDGTIQNNGINCESPQGCYIVAKDLNNGDIEFPFRILYLIIYDKNVSEGGVKRLRDTSDWINERIEREYKK